MPAYEYLCLACELPFEERRPMTSAVDVALACPSCGSERVRRRFSFIAPSGSTASPGSAGVTPMHGCACGGACGC